MLAEVVVERNHFKWSMIEHLTHVGTSSLLHIKDIGKASAIRKCEIGAMTILIYLKHYRIAPNCLGHTWVQLGRRATMHGNVLVTRIPSS